jgi:tetratricopeptide (TPR) repeat protein
MPFARRLCAALSVCAIVASGCGGAKYAARAPSAMDSAAAPPPMAGPAGDSAATGKVATGEQAETWRRSQIAANTARVMVGDREELPLRGLQAQVTIDGFRARVILDYLYANPHQGTLEGTFQLRLPEEATPHFFAFGSTRFEARTEWSRPMVIATSEPGAGAGALPQPSQIMAERRDAWIDPKEARMVPRDQASQAYGETVRGRVDPALVEWAGAGVFNARVFPLAAGQLHRIVVGYDVDLVRIGESLEYRLELPEKLPAAVVDIGVTKPGAATVAVTPAAAPAAGGAAGGASGRQHYHFEDPRAREITVRLDKAGAPLLAGRDPTLGDVFAAQVAPRLPADSSTAARNRDAAVFLVDTSLSSNPDRFNVWLKLLRAVLEQNRDSLRRFNVLFFGVDARWYQGGYVDNTPENVEALLAYAHTLALEGATDLGAALAAAARPAWAPAGGPAAAARHDVFLLSDGAATWGEANLHALGRTLAAGAAGPLYAYQTGLAGTDVAALTHLARETGGAVFSVTGESEVARAATAHRARPWRLTGVKIAGATDVLLAGRPTTLFPGQTLLAVGRGAIAPGAELELTVERDGQSAVVRAPLSTPIPSGLAARAYGQIATAQLEELEDATASAARAYAMHFRVTGRTCSLLMLESEADYQRFKIVPEADGRVVAATPAGALVERTRREVYERLGDPKQAFLAMLARLERTPGVSFRLSAAYVDAMKRLPPEVFAVPSAPLATRLVTRAQLPPGMLSQLASHQLDYDTVSADAQIRRGAGGPADALKALSSLVEEHPGDAVLARDVGYSAMDLGLRPQAYHLFRRVAELRPYEPQTYRAMAQALAAMGNADLALAYYEIPLLGEWDGRFGDLRKIVELDYLRHLRKIASGAAHTRVPEYARARLAQIGRDVGLRQADVLVTITWNTDNSDVDLHVIEPTGEECSYKNRRTRIGGQLTQDVTRGYGPEMYVLPRAPEGRFSIRAHYYARDRNRASARTKVYATITEGWGTANERVTEKVLALTDGREWHDIATLVARSGASIAR